MDGTLYYVVAHPDGTYYGTNEKHECIPVPLYDATMWQGEVGHAMAEHTAWAYNSTVELWNISPVDAGQEKVILPCGLKAEELTTTLVWDILAKEPDPIEVLRLLGRYADEKGTPWLEENLTLAQCIALHSKVYGFEPVHGNNTITDILRSLFHRRDVLSGRLNFEVFPVDTKQTRTMEYVTYNMLGCQEKDRPLSWVKMYLSSRLEEELLGAMSVDEVLELYYLVFHEINTDLTIKEMFHAVCVAAVDYKTPDRPPSKKEERTNEDMVRRFACRLLILRKKAGKAVNDVAAACDIAPSRLRHLEFGKGDPNLRELWVLSKYCEVTRDFMIW